MSIIHLVRDFEEVVFNYGKEKGLIFSENNRTQAVIRILNFYRKIGIGNKKVISYARNIKIPKKYQKRVESVLNYLSRGGDITVNDTLRMYKNDDIRMYNFDCITDTIVEVITTCNTYTLLTVHLL